MKLGANGFQKSTAEEIRQNIIDHVTSQIPGFEAQPADFQSNIIDTSVGVCLQFEDYLAAMYNAYAPDYAVEDLFIKFGKSLGLYPKSEYKSQVMVTFKGEKGSYIPEGTVVSTEDELSQFSTEKSAVIDSTGSCSVLALGTSDEIVGVGQVTKLKTLLDNVTVTNETESLSYIPAETFAEYKKRVQDLYKGVSNRGGRLYAESLIKKVDGVNQKLVSINESSNENQKTVEVIVGGGDDIEVSKAIYEGFLETQLLISSPSNGETNRTVSQDIQIYGYVSNVKFTRPKPINLYLKGTLSLYNNVISSKSATAISKQAFIDYFNSLTVGSKVSVSTLNSIFYKALQDQGIDIGNLKDIKFSYKTVKDPEATYSDFGADNLLPGIEHDTYIVLEQFNIEDQL